MNSENNDTMKQPVKEEPAIPWLIRMWKERKIIRKQREIKELKLEIERTKLQKQLNWANKQ